MKKSIGVIDSGMGAMLTMDVIKSVLPNEDYIIYMDYKNNPYGEKSVEELFRISCEIVDYLYDLGCSVIVIVCNTLTCNCMNRMKEKYKDIVFIGTVPAIKVAYDHNKLNTLVMATKGTVFSYRLGELNKSFKRDNQIINYVPCIKLVSAIESMDESLIRSVLNDELAKFVNTGIDSIVLGCTHYPYVKKYLLEMFGDVEIYDSSMGVALELKRQLILLGHNLEEDKLGTTTIIRS